MKHITAALICEIIKLKRSKIFWITIVFFIFIPTMIGLLMYIAQHPEISAKLGIIGTKASLFGENDWAGYFMTVNQILATVGLIGFGFVTAWVFGREYSEKTLTDILALPASRISIVISKFITVTLWCSILSAVLYAVSITIGNLIDIPGKSVELIRSYTTDFLITFLLSLMLCSPVAFFASYGKGIFAPIGFVIITLITAQFVSLIGWGPYFPWAVPGVNTVPEGTEGMTLVPLSYLIVIITSLAFSAATGLWWVKADHH